LYFLDGNLRIYIVDKEFNVSQAENLKTVCENGGDILVGAIIFLLTLIVILEHVEYLNDPWLDTPWNPNFEIHVAGTHDIKVIVVFLATDKHEVGPEAGNFTNLLVIQPVDAHLVVLHLLRVCVELFDQQVILSCVDQDSLLEVLRDFNL